MSDRRPWLRDREREPVAGLAHGFPQPSGARPVRAPFAPEPSGQSRLAVLHRDSITETRRHGRRLAAFSAALGRRLNVSDADLGLLRVGSLLHDVGKNALPPQVLFKCGRLTAEEFAAVKCHPAIGDALCSQVPALESVRPIVRHHHERLDGSGYPDGLRGREIPFLAQIVGIVDVYDALVCRRPYKPAFDSTHALEILRREVELGWRRADLVAAWIEVVESGASDWTLVATSV